MSEPRQWSHFDRCRCPFRAVLLLRYIETFCIGLKLTGNNVHDAVQRCRAAARRRTCSRCSGYFFFMSREPRQRKGRSRPAAIGCCSCSKGCGKGISKKGRRQGGTTSWTPSSLFYYFTLQWRHAVAAAAVTKAVEAEVAKVAEVASGGVQWPRRLRAVEQWRRWPLIFRTRRLPDSCENCNCLKRGRYEESCW